MTTKYKNKKVDTPYGVFDSKKEFRRFKELKSMELSGDIKNLRRQEKYVLIPTQYETVISGTKAKKKCLERSCTYVADFVYERDGNTIVEDVKGYRGGGAYAVFKIKKKLMLEKYNIKVMEV